MAKLKTVAPTDPTLPTAKVTLAGTEYTLCLDQRALADAEMHFALQGHNVNLLVAYSRLNLSSVMAIFPCAVHRFHPELEFDDAQKLVNAGNAMYIGQELAVLWTDAHPDPEPAKGNE